MFQKLRFSTRAHLLALGVAIITPLLIFAAILLFQYANYERERTEKLAEQLAINIGGVVDAEIEHSLALLRGLAASAALSSRNYAQFHEEARRALGRDDSVIIVRDVEGQQFMNTQVPPGEAPRRAVPLSTQELAAYTAGRPFVSNVYRAPPRWRGPLRGGPADHARRRAGAVAWAYIRHYAHRRNA